jgi:hypothetical protein
VVPLTCSTLPRQRAASASDTAITEVIDVMKIGHIVHTRSVLPVEQRLVGLVCELGRGLGYLDAARLPLSVAAKVCTGNARRPAARQHKANHLVDHGFVRVTAHQFVPLLHQVHCNISVFIATWAASASARGDRRCSRRKYRK